MMRENESIPESERLEEKEFNLDVDEQKRLEALVEEEALRVMCTCPWNMKSPNSFTFVKLLHHVPF